MLPILPTWIYNENNYGLVIGAPLKCNVQKEGGVFIYYAFLRVVFTPKQPSSYKSFDLRIQPEGVCFRLMEASEGVDSNPMS